MNIAKTEGLIAAPFTPFRADGSLHLDVIDDYARWLHSNGVVGAFVCGTTGESASLTVTERKQVAERWVAAAPAGLRVIVHVGHTVLAESRDLAAHAASIGAGGMACMAPFFFKPTQLPNLAEWCVQVAAGAPKLPFYYYHIPSMSGVTLPVADLLEAVAPRIPNLAGVKFTFEDLKDFERCLRLSDGRFDMLFGRDEIFLTAMKLGARGAVGSTFNFAAPVYRALIQAHDQGDLAEAARWQTLATQMIDILIKAGPYPVATFKWFMKRVGLDCGPIRMPFSDLTPAQIAAVEIKLQELGIFRWVSRKGGAS